MVRPGVAWPLGALIIVGASLRLWVLYGTQRLSADEAIPGLMARHILYARELPVFYWGQTYFGALEAYLIAGFFAVLGFHTWLVFAPAALASVALIPLAWMLADYLGPAPAGLIAAVPLACAPPVLGRLLVNSGGGFALGCALQLTTLLLVLRALRASSRSVQFSTLAMVALTGGVAAWVWQPALLTLPVLLVVLFAAVREFRSLRGLACATLVLVGLLPMLIANVGSDWPTVTAVLRKFDQQSLPVDGPVAQTQQFTSILLAALGGTDETSGGSNPVQAAVLLAALVVGPLWIAWEAWRRPCRLARQRLVAMAVVMLATAVGLVVAHGSARYVIATYVVAAALTGALLAELMRRTPRFGRAVAAAWLLACVLPSLLHYKDLARVLPPDGLSQLDQTDAALDALQQRGLTTGYADYWTAYPLMYVSAERVIVAPALPPPYSGRLDRYPAYTARVDDEHVPQRVFLLVETRCATQPYLDTLQSEGATFRAEPVARWLLIWDIQPPAGDQADVLAGLRATIAAQQTC
ncbi:MAG: hypothetical protein JO057_19235 [Chloroflexi bacterium]|nr:hypothetical protein [Chloroflexota bacterium]